MRCFVTGAAGFLGRHVCASALERGHEVVALVRSERAARELVEHLPEVTIQRGDLAQPQTWRDALASCEVVIHLAADKSGQLPQQIAGNVITTETLLTQIRASGIRRLVHVSTFSVYDYQAVPVGGVLDENTPVEPQPYERQAYAQSKVLQERLVREAMADGLEAVILRPGAVWGRGDLWHGGRAQVVAALWVTGGDAIVDKFTYVENCAEAIVLAVDAPRAAGQIYNLVDDDIPPARRYAADLRQHGQKVPTALPVPYALLRLVAQGADWANARWFQGRLRLPSLLITRELDSRLRPLHYPNSKARSGLGWTPRYDAATALQRALAPVSEPPRAP